MSSWSDIILKTVKPKYIFDNEKIKEKFELDILTDCMESRNKKQEYYIYKIKDVYDEDNELEYIEYNVSVHYFNISPDYENDYLITINQLKLIN